MKIYGLYCVCDLCWSAEGRIRYVGQTWKEVEFRFREHLSNSRKASNDRIGGLAVYRWVRKHGAKNIRYRILEEVQTQEAGDAAERRWIKELNTFGPGGLNMTEGGLGKSGYRHSQETKDQISMKKRGRPGFNKSGLTDAQFKEIKIRLWNGETPSELSEEYGVSRKTIKDVNQGKTKNHIPWPIGPRERTRTKELRQDLTKNRVRDGRGRLV